MGCKVVLVGGGSHIWTPTFAADLFLRKGLEGSRLVLVDIDQDAAQTMKRYCDVLACKANTGWIIEIDELEAALEGATVVCISISTGGLEAMAHDCSIPEKYGVYHTVGDTVGPAGISRTLRNVPVFIDIARKMEKICPDAWLVHVTNPLSQLTRAVCIETSIKCIGLCHNYDGTMSMLADYLGADVEDLNATSVGVNHFTWLKNITCKGEPVEDQLSLERYIKYYYENNPELKSNTADDEVQKELVEQNMDHYLNFALFERFGYFPVGSSNHLAENLPFYCNDLEVMKKYHIQRKEVLPRRQILKDQRLEKVQRQLEGEEEIPELKLSNEGFSAVVESLYTGRPTRCIVAMPNQGQISNLPRDVIVETWAEINGSGIFPLTSGNIPEILTGYMRTIVDEQEITVQAALTGERQYVVQAMAISPQVQNKDVVEEMADELLKVHKDLLPQFKI